ncbi:MAG: Arc family DNA-binding protein [Burkholderiales bacterium]|jgi:plasmid stability protein|nr:Arc family DNA-binding protein [Burkholderiales bacterium]
MSTLTIRNIDDATKDKLRQAAASHGRSMEEEVRTILRNALAQSTPTEGLGSRIHARFAALGGYELELPARTELPRGVDPDTGAAS